MKTTYALENEGAKRIENIRARDHRIIQKAAEVARKSAQASEREERALQNLKQQRATALELVKASRSGRRAAAHARRIL